MLFCRPVFIIISNRNHHGSRILKNMSKENQLPDYLENGEQARLIPVGKGTQRENRATSVLLSGMSSILPLSKTLLGEIGQFVGSRAKLQCYSQVVFKNDPSKGKFRPDGLIELQNGKRFWRSIVESKIGGSVLNEEQILAYAQIAKANGINSIITISNQFASLPTHHPVKINRALPKGITIYHWSWAHILTTAVLKLESDELDSEHQRYLLSEFIRYFEHPTTGVERFTQMNPEWKEIVTQVQQGAGLGRRTDQDKVLNTVASWHQETRDLCLHLTESLKQKVRPRLPSKHVADPEFRLKDGIKRLKDTAQLSFTLTVPDAADDIEIIADIRSRTIIVSMEVNAPKDRKTAKARINWLLRQLRSSKPEDIIITAYWPKRAQTSSEGLEKLRENPELLESPAPNLAPRKFSVKLAEHVGAKFSGRRTFIEAVEECVPHFYREVGQRLRAWVPTPPKSPPEPQRDSLEASVQEMPTLKQMLPTSSGIDNK